MHSRSLYYQAKRDLLWASPMKEYLKFTCLAQEEQNLTKSSPQRGRLLKELLDLTNTE